MNTRQYFLLFFALHFLFIEFSLFAQDRSKDFERINSVYQQHPVLSMTVVYNLYESYTSQSPFDTKKAYIKRSHEKQHYQLLDFESLTNDRFSIAIDHGDKFLHVKQAPPASSKTSLPLDLDSLFRNYKAVKFFKAQNQSQYAYRLTFSHSAHESAEIYFNKESYVVEKLVLFLRNSQNLRDPNSKTHKQKPRLEILCKDVNFKPDFAKSTFSETRFIVRRKGKISLQPQFQKYRLVTAIK